MLHMSSSTANALSRILLVGEPSRTAVAAARPGGSSIRRYRLARLRLNGPSPGAGPYAHLRRSYD
jgi:hypothetical protein